MSHQYGTSVKTGVVSELSLKGRRGPMYHVSMIPLSHRAICVQPQVRFLSSLRGSVFVLGVRTCLENAAYQYNCFAICS